MTLRAFAIVGALLAGTAGLSAAQAAYVVDTGAPNITTGPYSIYFNNAGDYQELAGQFTLASATKITGVEGFLNSAAGHDVTISIYAGSIAAPNQVLTGSFTTATVNNWQGLAGLNTVLGAGTYWVSFVTDAARFNMNMYGVAPSPLAAYAFRNASTAGVWTASPINVGVRIEGMNAVPEPATWAMMIGGFALAGAAMRRRQVAVRFA